MPGLGTITSRAIANHYHTLGQWQSWLLENKKLMDLDNVVSVARIEERTCMGWCLNWSILRQLPANNSLKRNPFVIDETALDWMVTLKSSEWGIYIEKSL